MKSIRHPQNTENFTATNTKRGVFRRNIQKFRINSDFINAMEIRLVEKKDAMKMDHEQNDIYQDQGHGKNQMYMANMTLIQLQSHGSIIR